MTQNNFLMTNTKDNDLIYNFHLWQTMTATNGILTRTSSNQDNNSETSY